MTVNGSGVERKLSRGQLKMVVFALHLAQVDLMRELQGVLPVLLIDDLAAELDTVNQQILLGELAGRSNQVFVTGIVRPPIDGIESVQMFHVEQGAVTEVTI